MAIMVIAEIVEWIDENEVIQVVKRRYWKALMK
jgi:hypothetical protein